jgi:hypothetical protein
MPSSNQQLQRLVSYLTYELQNGGGGGSGIQSINSIKPDVSQFFLFHQEMVS